MDPRYQGTRRRSIRRDRAHPKRDPPRISSAGSLLSIRPQPSGAASSVVPPKGAMRPGFDQPRVHRVKSTGTGSDLAPASNARPGSPASRTGRCTALSTATQRATHPSSVVIVQEPVIVLQQAPCAGGCTQRFGVAGTVQRPDQRRRAVGASSPRTFLGWQQEPSPEARRAEVRIAVGEHRPFAGARIRRHDRAGAVGVAAASVRLVARVIGEQTLPKPSH